MKSRSLDRLVAHSLLEWAELQERADHLAEEIEIMVCDLGKTVTVGDIRASYRKPTQRMDYEAMAPQIPEDILRKHTTVVERVAWAKACEEAGVTPPVKEDVPAKVTLKFVD